MKTLNVQPSLDGVRAKIDRAREHIEQLKAVLDAASYAKTDATFGVDEQTKQRIYIVTLTEVPDVPIKARLIVGDVVHSLAAALDHLVYQLSLSKTRNTAECDAHKTHFPIFADDDKESIKTINKRLALMDAVPADLIRAMQPYKRRPAHPRSDPLWVLFRLDVIDKHRIVLAANQVASVQAVTFSAPGFETVTNDIEQRQWQHFKAGTELFRVSFKSDDVVYPKTNIHAKVMLQVRFEETGLYCDGKPVVGLLNELINIIEAEVINPLAPFVK